MELREKEHIKEGTHTFYSEEHLDLNEQVYQPKLRPVGS